MNREENLEKIQILQEKLKKLDGGIEYTLAVIKPEGIKFKKQIISTIKNEGFSILKVRTVHLSSEQASELYSQHYGDPMFPLLVATTSSAPIVVLYLAKVNAVKHLLTLAGPNDVAEARNTLPNSLNAKYGNFDGICNFNCIYASCSARTAEKEIKFFFPQGYSNSVEMIADKVDYLNETVNPILKEGLAQLCKVKPAEPMLWLAAWLQENSPDMPGMPSHLHHTVRRLE